MSKRMQVVLSQEAWQIVEAVTMEASEGFEAGSIGYSDTINELILCSKVDVKALQLKHTDLRRSLRVLASKDDLDLDTVLKALNEIKAQAGKRKALPVSKEVG